ncbi:MAG: hypothetical protein ACE5G2_08575 [Candidatus Krumholzibacteriia bacterium]
MRMRRRDLRARPWRVAPSPASWLQTAAVVIQVSTSSIQSTQQATTSAEASSRSLSARLEAATLDRLLARNLDAVVSLPETLLADRLSAWRDLPIGARVARWAELFLERGDAVYLFGLGPGGYVADSLLVQDFKPDCVLFSYRCSELARSRTPQEAVTLALETRFAGARPASAVTPSGAVDYDDPSHLDYSLDIVRSGLWGRDVTLEVGEARVDSAGTSRYPARSFRYIPTEALRLDRLEDGDLLFFVLDENSKRGRKMREEYGLVVGHQGIARRGQDTVYAIHAAQRDLPGEYAGNRIVRVPLLTYLRRVESFKGVLVTRLEE